MAFYSTVGFDHSAPDDPIVHFGVPGASHLHDFCGAKGVTAFTKPADLIGGPTTAHNPGATAAYWMPALFVDGVKQDPILAVGHYGAGGKDPGTIQAFPAGLVMVAGGKGSGRIDWGCYPEGDHDLTNEDVAPCGEDSQTFAVVQFPDCWDGKNLDSPDHRSHMAYSVKVKGKGVTQCPPTHPVPVIGLGLRFYYGILPPGLVSLSSGPPNSLHADFMNSWDQAFLEQRVQEEFGSR